MLVSNTTVCPNASFLTTCKIPLPSSLIVEFVVLPNVKGVDVIPDFSSFTSLSISLLKSIVIDWGAPVFAIQSFLIVIWLSLLNIDGSAASIAESNLLILNVLLKSFIKVSANVLAAAAVNDIISPGTFLLSLTLYLTVWATSAKRNSGVITLDAVSYTHLTLPTICSV